MFMKKIVFIIVIALAIVIPISTYIAYPSIDDPKPVEKVIDYVYNDMHKPLPRFIPGIIGYVFVHDINRHSIALSLRSSRWILKSNDIEFLSSLCLDIDVNILILMDKLLPNIYKQYNVYSYCKHI